MSLTELEARRLADDLEAAARVLRAMQGQDPNQPAIAVSIDGRSARWFGRYFEFTAMQGACVRLLWQAYLNRTPTLGGETLLAEVEASGGSRVCHIFDKGRHPSWGVMIVAGTPRNSFRISENPPQPHGIPQLSCEGDHENIISLLRDPESNP